ncbi:MAG: hypothetical protein ACLP7O_07930 [Terracidiphilus sp.]
MPLLDQIRAEKLIQLARDRFNPKLRRAELKVLRDSASSVDPDLPTADAPRPPIRPEFVRWLATEPKTAPFIDPKGLRVFGITLPGVLDLKNCRILVTLHFQQCTMDGEFDLLSAETRGIFLLDSSFDRVIRADRIDVDGPLFLRGSCLSDGIRLLGAKIKGDLDCARAKLKVIEGDAFFADRAEIGGGVFLCEGFESSGEIRLLGAKIKGNLDCSGAMLEVKEGDALSADSAEIGGSVFLRTGFESTGEIRLLGTQIRGDLDCSGAKLQVTEGNTLSAVGAEIGGRVVLRAGFESNGTILLPGVRIGGDLVFLGAKITGVYCKNLRLTGDMYWMGIEKPRESFLDLTGATVKNLHDDRESWPHPGHLILDGLAYEVLTLHKPPTEEEIENGYLPVQLAFNVDERVEWLMLQPPDLLIEPQPWMQLSKLLQDKGNRKDAKHVIFMYRCFLARKKGLLRRWASIAYAWLEEKPLRIYYSYMFTLVFGTLIYAGAARCGAMMESEQILPNVDQTGLQSKTASIHYPPFQPFVYTLENAVPVIKLGMDDKWMPDPKHEPQPWFPQIRWLNWLAFFNSYGFLVFSRWGLIVWGWAQTIVLPGSVAERFKK